MPPTSTAPVALTLFNRPSAALRVFETIRQARPSRLFLIADEGRTPEEKGQCRQTRASIEDAIDWPCEVNKNYASENMGAKARLATGIAWVFDHTDRAIILEHDCLPTPTFFTYATELLERYKDDERVMHIAGTNFHQHDPEFVCPDSYYFSQIPLIWGFATWARAWKHYDVDLSLWPRAEKEKWLVDIFPQPAVRDRWDYLFREYYAGSVENWDGQWTFACIIQNGLSITPAVNLVTNIGFVPGALTTTDPNHPLSMIPTESILLPLSHPVAMHINRAADAYLFRFIFDVDRTLADRIRIFIKYRLPSVYRILRRRA
jgi:hypothetical protein